MAIQRFLERNEVDSRHVKSQHLGHPNTTLLLVRLQDTAQGPLSGGERGVERVNKPVAPLAVLPLAIRDPEPPRRDAGRVSGVFGLPR
jgi:hypothetical protein